MVVVQGADMAVVLGAEMMGLVVVAARDRWVSGGWFVWFCRTSFVFWRFTGVVSRCGLHRTGDKERK